MLELIVNHIQTEALKELNLNNHGHRPLFEMLGIIIHHIQTKALKELNLNNHGHRPWRYDNDHAISPEGVESHP